MSGITAIWNSPSPSQGVDMWDGLPRIDNYYVRNSTFFKTDFSGKVSAFDS